MHILRKRERLQRRRCCGAGSLQLVVSFLFVDFGRLASMAVLIVFIVQIFVVLGVFGGLGFIFGLLALLGFLGFLDLLLALLGFLEGGSGLVGSFNVVGDQEVVEDGTGLDLPQIQTNAADLLAQVQVLLGVLDCEIPTRN